MGKFFLYLKKADWILLVAVFLLISFGLVEIYSVALSNSSLGLDNFQKQLGFAFIGLIAMFLSMFVNFNNLRSFGVYYYFGGIALLVGVLLFGKTVRGTTGWYDLGIINLQPVEFIKVFLIIFLAKYFSGVSIKLKPLKHLVLSGFGALIFVVLVILQPDFGSSLVLFLLWGLMVVIAGFKKKYILLIAFVLALVFLSGFLFFFEDYQINRIMTFVNPQQDSLGRGYNINQAIIAIGSGRLVGRGVGFGSQSQLKFLPEAQNDFIFAVIAEELGYLGVCLVLALFAIIFYRLIKFATKISNEFAVYFLSGTAALIFIEMFINIGMNSGIMPVVGISLPFLSYGGSALLTTLVLIGISENIIIRSKIKY